MSAPTGSIDAAIDHLEHGQPDLALEVLEPLCVEGRSAGSSADTISAAAALFVKGLILFKQDRLEDAFKAHRDCVRRHGHLFDYEVQLRVSACLASPVMGAAVERYPALLAELPAAHHAFRMDTTTEMFRTIEVEMADATPAQRQEVRETVFTIVRNDDARASEQHEKALTVLRDHFSNGRPFGLYLRNFDIEASEKRLSDGTLLTMTTSEQGYVEARAERDLGSSLPMLGLANGVNFRKDFAHRIPKLEVAHLMWQPVLRILADCAKTVLFDYRHPSPGVAVELELLQSLGRIADTVVIVGDERARADVREKWPAFTRVQLPDEPFPVVGAVDL